MMKSKEAGSNALNHLTYLLFLFLLWSCSPDPLPVKEIPEVKPEIVVATQIVPNQSLMVLLTKTVGALDASDDTDPEKLQKQLAINDAIVTITGPKRSNSLSLLGNGVYGGSDIAFEAGETYKLDVKSTSMGEVEAVTTVSPRVLFDKIQADLYYNGFDDTLPQISYSLHDPVEKNWYMFTVQKLDHSEAFENVINPRSFTKLLEDKEFNGQIHQEQFRAFRRDYQSGDTIAVTLSNISEEYYRFMKLRIDNRFSFIEFLSEPVNYPSNVKGGKGFFNLYIPDVRIFVFK